ncbi:hypothetical protein BJV77DRAFT_395721 [Russula vinacea]|nr:hypothetical protein BJV77DRAFT_395721 [Russula vinacea]
MASSMSPAGTIYTYPPLNRIPLTLFRFIKGRGAGHPQLPRHAKRPRQLPQSISEKCADTNLTKDRALNRSRSSLPQKRHWQILEKSVPGGVVSRSKAGQIPTREVGDTVYLSFCHISPEAYVEEPKTVAISCIYRKETRETWYTSVDMIRLVEYIAQSQFSSEEKSRIRRNLEFLHPTTVTRTGMPQFFQILMDFPIPKPRVIEKDIKVFQWNSLEAGLKKVLEKYTWTDSDELETPQILVLRFRNLCYPRTNFPIVRNILHRIPSPLLPHLTVPIHPTTWGSPPTSCETCSSTHIGFKPTAIESGS